MKIYETHSRDKRVEAGIQHSSLGVSSDGHIPYQIAEFNSCIAFIVKVLLIST